MPSIALRDSVSLAYLVIAVGILLFLGLFALSRSRIGVGPARSQFIDGLLGALVFVVVLPAVIVAGAGGYILQANTGYYGTPGDFRNSETFVNLCWFCIAVVAPAFVLLGTAVLGSTAFRVWQTRRPPEDHRRGSS